MLCKYSGNKQSFKLQKVGTHLDILIKTCWYFTFQSRYLNAHKFNIYPILSVSHNKYPLIMYGHIEQQAAGIFMYLQELDTINYWDCEGFYGKSLICLHLLYK